VDVPAPGQWTVQVSGAPGPGIEHITSTWFVEAGALQLTASLSDDVVSSADTVVLTASLSDIAGPVPAAISAVIQGPDGASWALALHDDGLDGDEFPGDGIHSAWFVAPAIDGGFRARVSATAGDGTERAATLPFAVQHRPDIELRAGATTWAPSLTAVGRLTEVRTWAFNRGNVAADSATVSFVDLSTGETLGTKQVNVAAADSTLATIQFTPGASGVHAIQIVATSPGGVEGTTENNAVVIDLPVGGTPPSVGVGETVPILPARFELAPPRPNPFRDGVTIDLALPRAAPVVLEIYDVQGRRVRVLENGVLPPGRHSRFWDGRLKSGAPARSGVYFVRMTAPDVDVRRKAILVR
jgi:hypothetical protein